MYNWKLETPSTTYRGESTTLHSALDSLVRCSYGKDERDFYVNGHHMNEEFGLWVIGGRVVHGEDGSDFVPTNEWYDRLGGLPPEPTFSGILDNLARANRDFDRVFRPQPTRGCAPTHPDTLRAKGIEV